MKKTPLQLLSMGWIDYTLGRVTASSTGIIAQVGGKVNISKF